MTKSTTRMQEHYKAPTEHTPPNTECTGTITTIPPLPCDYQQ